MWYFMQVELRWVKNFCFKKSNSCQSNTWYDHITKHRNHTAYHFPKIFSVLGSSQTWGKYKQHAIWKFLSRNSGEKLSTQLCYLRKHQLLAPCRLWHQLSISTSLTTSETSLLNWKLHRILSRGRRHSLSWQEVRAFHQSGAMHMCVTISPVCLDGMGSPAIKCCLNLDSARGQRD